MPERLPKVEQYIVDALAENDRLKAENERLRAALERIKAAEQQWYVLAREALEPPVEGVPGLEG